MQLLSILHATTLCTCWSGQTHTHCHSAPLTSGCDVASQHWPRSGPDLALISWHPAQHGLPLSTCLLFSQTTEQIPARRIRLSTPCTGDLRERSRPAPHTCSDGIRLCALLFRRGVEGVGAGLRMAGGLMDRGALMPGQSQFQRAPLRWAAREIQWMLLQSSDEPSVSQLLLVSFSSSLCL